MSLKIKTISIINILSVYTFLIIFIFGCGKKDESKIETPDTHTEESGHTEDEHGGEVALTEEQIKIMGIEFAKIENQNINGYIKANGEIMINPDNESKVGSIIPGRVKKIYVKEGSFVRAGQTLAIIENLDLISAQVDYLEAKHEYEHAKIEYERQQMLASSDIGSKKDLAKIKVEYEHTVIGLKSAEQRLLSYKIPISKLENYEDMENSNELQRYYPISAPISGNVVSRKITVGQYIEPSSDMFYIVNTSTVFVDLSIFEKDLPYVSIGQKVKIEMNTNSNKEYEGKISFINKVFDDKNRTVKVRVSINNRDQELYPFMFVTAKIYINDGNVLAVPITAIESEGESKYIFVKTNERKKIETHAEHSGEEEHKEGEEEHKEGEEEHKEGEEEHKKGEEEHKEGEEEHKEGDEHDGEEGIVFKKYQVNTGISDDKYVEIFPFEEVKDGEEVVSKGTFYLKSELKKEDLGEHEH